MTNDDGFLDAIIDATYKEAEQQLIGNHTDTNPFEPMRRCYYIEQDGEFETIQPVVSTDDISFDGWLDAGLYLIECRAFLHFGLANIHLDGFALATEVFFSDEEQGLVIYAEGTDHDFKYRAWIYEIDADGVIVKLRPDDRFIPIPRVNTNNTAGIKGTMLNLLSLACLMSRATTTTKEEIHEAVDAMLEAPVLN